MTKHGHKGSSGNRVGPDLSQHPQTVSDVAAKASKKGANLVGPASDEANRSEAQGHKQGK